MTSRITCICVRSRPAERDRCASGSLPTARSLSLGAAFIAPSLTILDAGLLAVRSPPNGQLAAVLRDADAHAVQPRRTIDATTRAFHRYRDRYLETQRRARLEHGRRLYHAKPARPPNRQASAARAPRRHARRQHLHLGAGTPFETQPAHRRARHVAVRGNAGTPALATRLAVARSVQRHRRVDGSGRTPHSYLFRFCRFAVHRRLPP